MSKNRANEGPAQGADDRGTVEHAEADELAFHPDPKMPDERVEYQGGGTPTADPAWAESFIAPRQLLPSTRWIATEITGKGVGTRARIARIFGVAYAGEPQEHQHGDKLLKSIAFSGLFEAENLITGEVTRAPTLYLPNSYAKQIMLALQMAGEGARVELDIALGVEAIDRSIPFRYTIQTFVEDDMARALASLRRRRHPALGAPAREAPRLIEGVAAE